ncbi:MAG: FtsX-like permease family protein [Chloroflexi bacterium]|nr:FtsX-like permease family protein [Chloroflexota bacterium]MDA1227167.1 FtsX-like permease family protein [Chloroflexota bacterium]
MIAKRSLAHWRLLSTVIVGVLLASTVMSGTVVYFEALRELALDNTLNGLTTEEIDILVKADRGPTTVEEFQKVSTVVDRQVEGRLAWLLRGQERAARTATFFATEPGNEEEAGEDNARTYFVFMPSLLDNITLLNDDGGRLPVSHAVNAIGETLMVEAIVPADEAAIFGVGVGDVISAVPHWQDRTPYVSVMITGLFERNDPEAEFWHMDDRLVKNATSGGSFRSVPFFVSDAGFFNVLGQAFPDMNTSYIWLLKVDPEKLNASNTTFARLQITTMKRRLSSNLFSFRQITELDDALADYDRRLFFSKLPMFIIMVLIAVVILYYVVTLSSLLVEQQRGEIGLMRSRGATSAQILTVFVLEGATISAVAIIVAPLLAATVISLLGFTPAFSGLSDVGRLTVNISTGAYLMAALGGLLSFAALMVPAVYASRISVRRQRQDAARPDAPPFFQRFYLDVMLLVISIFLFRQLTQQGSIVATGLFGEMAINQVLLAVPAVILVAFALVLLRLFPLAIRFISGDSPSLMHLVVGFVVALQLASVTFNGALYGEGFGWVFGTLAIAVLGGLYWATERSKVKSYLIAGLAIQTLLVAVLTLVGWDLPSMDFLAFSIGQINVTPAIAAGVMLVSLTTDGGGVFVPFPLGALFLLVSAFARRAPVGYSMGMWQMARNPTHYARLSLLLILMAGLGIFAASFSGTLERSFQEQAQYSTGSDIRLEGLILNNLGDSVPLVESYKSMPAVDELSPVLRAFGTDLSRLIGESYTMIALDGPVISDIGWFRSDFSDDSMSEMLAALEHPRPPQGLAIPDDALYMGARVISDRPHSTVALTLRIRDANDRHFSYVLGTLNTTQWQDMELPLERASRFGRQQHPLQPERPLTLVSMTIHDTDSRGRLRAGSVTIDEIWSRDASGAVTTIENFDEFTSWAVLRGATQSKTDVLQESVVSYNGDAGSALFVWSEGTPLTGRGIYHGPEVNPLPVLASRSFLKETGHKVGQEFQVSVSGHRVPISIVNEINYFPTLDTINKSYLISDLQSIIRYTNLETTSAEVKPNELWMSTTGGPERQELVRLLQDTDEPFIVRKVHDRVQALDESKVDPLVQAGWRALLFMAFGAVLILSCLGFLVHAYVSFREREMQFGLMRTIGFSMRQMVTLVLVEQALVIAAGMAMGAEMGRRLGSIIMPFLSHNDQGTQVLPPFVLEINWGTLAITYGFMIVVFALIILGMIWFIRRISLQRILRLGEL